MIHPNSPEHIPGGITYIPPKLDEWIDITKQPPEEGAVIDVWQGYANPDTGEFTGHRLTNAWFFEGRILHGKGSVPVNAVTHWMDVPQSPHVNT